MKKPKERARSLSEDDARELCGRAAAELGLSPRESGNLAFAGAPCGRELWDRAPGGEALELIRVGPLLFVDDARYRGLSEALRAELGPNAIRLKDLKGGTLAGPIGGFTACALAALLHADLAGKHAIDLGAGDGVLSLTAARLGASSLELVELDAKLLSAARTNLELNGLAERTDFRLVEADLADVDGALRRLKPGAAPSAVLCNIGYWEYGATNAEALILAGHLPKFELFVGGGYGQGAVGGLAHLDDDVSLLEAMGFRVRPERAELRQERSWRGEETAYALVAERAEVRRLSREELAPLLERRRGAGAAKRHALQRAALPWLVLALVAVLAAAAALILRQ